MIDPIVLLRDYTMKGKKVRNENEELVFGSTHIPLAAPTAWLKSGTQGEHYTIGALWVYLINSNAELRKYATDVKSYKVTPVSIQDKSVISDYFTGKTETVECIDEEFRASTQIPRHKRAPETSATSGRPEEMEVGEREEKKPLTENEQVLEWIARNEKKIATRHTQLQGLKVALGVRVELFGRSGSCSRLACSEKATHTRRVSLR